MGFKGPRRQDTRRRVARRTTFETLEDRQMFSAEPLGGLLGGSIEQHSTSEPPLVEHIEQQPDFWYEANLDRDLDAMVGDLEQTLASSNQFTGLTQARTNYGFAGHGQTVAVIDSGIAWDHPNLGNGFGANARVVGGWDFTEENDANPYDDGPAGSHGTHVAGIVGATSNAQGDGGVAPGVDLVGLRVFNDQGEGYFSWVEKALKWVHTNRNSYANPITAVNLSLGTAWNAATAPSWATLEDEFAQLKADGIFIAVSAGNSFSTYNTPGLSYPAASSSVVPVMSVDDSGSLSYFSQRYSRAIAAPGRSIRSTVPDYVGNQNGKTDDWANYSGTSMASPYVAGASVLIREAMQFVGYTNITEDTIYNQMMSTADEIFDSATNQVYERLNVGAALDALIPADDFGSTPETAHDLGPLGESQSISGLIGKLDDQDFFTFTASANGLVHLAMNASHGSAPNLSVTGAEATLADGTWTFDIVAGESYSIALSAGASLSHYNLQIDVSAAAPDVPDVPDLPAMAVKTLTGSDGAVYTLDSANWLSVNGARICSNTLDFAIANNCLYRLNDGGRLERCQSGNWKTLAENVSTFGVTAEGMWFSLGKDGWLSINGKPAWSNTQAFTLSKNTIYIHKQNGLLMRQDFGKYWVKLSDHAISFAVSPTGRSYFLDAEGWLNINERKGWSDVKAFALGADDTLYVLKADGSLYSRPESGPPKTLGLNVTEFAIRHDAAVYTLVGNGDLKVDGTPTCCNVRGMSTDNSGCLVVDIANGPVQRVQGRFAVSSKIGNASTAVGSSNAQTAGVRANLYQANAMTIGVDGNAQSSSMSIVDRAFTAAYFQSNVNANSIDFAHAAEVRQTLAYSVATNDGSYPSVAPLKAAYDWDNYTSDVQTRDSVTPRGVDESADSFNDHDDQLVNTVVVDRLFEQLN